jgi:hypothetical protein
MHEPSALMELLLLVRAFPLRKDTGAYNVWGQMSDDVAHLYVSIAC